MRKDFVKILLVILILVLPTLSPAFKFEIISGDAPVCSIDKTKDNLNDPCNPDNLENAKEENKPDSNITEEPVRTDKKPKSEKKEVVENKAQELPSDQKAPTNKKVAIIFFWGDGCPHCADEKPFLQSLKQKYPQIEIISLEVWHNKDNAIKFQTISSKFGLKSAGVPVTIIGTKAIVGFAERLKDDIEGAVIECIKKGCPNILDEKIFDETNQVNLTEQKDDMTKDTSKPDDSIIDIPFVGKTDLSKMALPLMTIVIAGLDSFNPCAFFVLFSLLGLMIHAKSRKRMFIIGGVFVFFSGFMYFLFMSAWLNFFIFMGEVVLITTIAGIVSIVIALINIKDFFIFKKGVSLTISDKHKGKLFDRMRKLLKSTSTLSMIIGAAVLAIAANTYELLCTAGFPMVFTRILTLNNLSLFQYYMYLLLYNVIYVIPLLLIVIFFTISLGKRQLSESEGRFLKLLSGMMMLGLGLALIIKPSLLNDVFISIVILIGAIVLTLAISFISKKLKLS